MSTRSGRLDEFKGLDGTIKKGWDHGATKDKKTDVSELGRNYGQPSTGYGLLNTSGGTKRDGKRGKCLSQSTRDTIHYIYVKLSQ